MNGYRERPNFDPYGSPTRPARPFNAAQWTGVALVVVSVLLNLAFLAGQAGWLPKWKDSPVIATTPMIFGVILMNSRREPVQDLAPELAPARRKWMIITVSVVGIILAVATIIDIVTGR